MDKEIGSLLRKYRENKGYSLSQAGDLIGRTKSCIYYYETGRNAIDVKTLDKLCTVYGTDMYSFIEELKK